MLPLDETLIVLTDYAMTARDLDVIVMGDGERGWFPKVRGTNPGDDAPVTVAYYEIDYPSKRDASIRGREMLGYVRALRRDTGWA